MRYKKQIFLSFLALLVFFGIAVYTKYASDDGLRSAGALEITAPADRVSVFVNNGKEKTIAVKGDTYRTSLPPGSHTVILSKDGFWPWMKVVDIEQGKVSSYRPFILRRTPVYSEIRSDDPERLAMLERTEKTEAPSPEAPLYSDDGNAAIWADNGALIARWIGNPKNAAAGMCAASSCQPALVIKPESGVGNAAFLKGRNNVVIFSSGDSIYAIEIAGTGGQNFQPLYSGTAPKFFITADGSVIVSDNGRLIKLETEI